MAEMGRHEVGWLQVVQAVDGGLPPHWERTFAGWIDRKRTAAPATGYPQTLNPNSERSLGD